MTNSPSPVLPLVFAEERNVLVNNIGCFRSIFKTFDTLDFDIHWSDLNISTAIELPISWICLMLRALLINDTYAKLNALLDTDVYQFSPSQGKLSPVRYNRSNRLRFWIQKYLDAIQLGQIVDADFFVKFKMLTPILTGGFPNSFGFVRPEQYFQALIEPHLHGGTLWIELNTKWFRNRDLLSREPSKWLSSS